MRPFNKRRQNKLVREDGQKQIEEEQEETPNMAKEDSISPFLKETPSSWEKIYKVKIIDPDGWRTDGQSFKKPITREEWEHRMNQSTIKIFRDNE